jgi:phenylpropionate dioxygenase-like ring-hydroxylating dioxygenase large terminal subunit
MDQTNLGNPVRTDFVPVDDYISKDFLRLENERVWPRVWLMACREEELGKAGSFVTFEIVRESILLVRQDSGAIKAFYNVCQHRGRRLKEGCGQSGRSIYCKFHGWSWNLDGSIQRVVHRAQWDGCPAFGDDDLHLPEVRVDTWGGWVFVTMNPDAPPLLDYLGEVPEQLACYALDKMRMVWGVTMITPANWKLVLNAFNEAYHVEATHPQTLRHNSSYLPSEARGIHAMFGPTLFDEVELPNRPAAMAALQRDPRDIILESFEEMQRDLQAMYLEPGVAAARRVHAEIAPGTDVREVGMKLLEFHREELEKRGVEWPEGLTPEAMHRAGFGWHLFPNFIILPCIDGALCYRTRPHPDNPDECVWDIWSFGRFAPGAEPVPEMTFVSDHREFLEKNRFLKDDLVNLPEVQKGMYSRGFKGLRTNPVQEQCVVNLHRTVHAYIEGEI